MHLIWIWGCMGALTLIAFIILKIPCAHDFAGSHSKAEESQGYADDGCASCLQASWSEVRSSQPHIPHLSTRITTLLHRMVTRTKTSHVYEVTFIKIHLNISSSPCALGGTGIHEEKLVYLLDRV